MFFVALESFVNLLYRLLLREDFKSKPYERLTRSDIDLRIISIHIFCEGFRRQPVELRSELWDRLIALRGFRNDIVHGNITEEHECHTLMEDCFEFLYLPASGFRGRHAQRVVPKGLSRFQPNIAKETVDTTKKTVDDLRATILGAMEPQFRAWVESWLWKPIILNPTPPGSNTCEAPAGH
jgi:hypothetical protein